MKHTKINYRNYLAELSVSRKPIPPEIPDYDPEFLNRVNNPKPPYVTPEEFKAALENRLAEENSSYAEKQIQEGRLHKEITSELQALDKEEEKIVDFIEYLSNKNEGKGDKEHE